MKTLDHDNWLIADPDRKGRVVDARAWREALLSIRLEPAVPGEIGRMFEAARAGMLYGHFFQPLLAMGVEQCYRVLEYGARMRCLQAGLTVTCTDSQGRQHPLSFAHNLRALARLGLITEAELIQWRQAPELRDWVAAPQHQAALTLEHGVTALSRAADLLGRLFQTE